MKSRGDIYDRRELSTLGFLYDGIGQSVGAL